MIVGSGDVWCCMIQKCKVNSCRKILQKLKKRLTRGFEGLRRHAEAHSFNENEASEEVMLSWVRSIRMFKKRAKKSKNTDMKNMLIARAN